LDMSTQAADASIGMMDGAYFASRKTILDFFNNLLHLNLTKIEQTASGAVACQVIDYIYPGSVPLHRVNWEAKSDYEFIQNYKLLQAAFTKNHVQRHVDVPKLIRAKYQDNLEFCQWLKAFFEMTARDRPDYDPVAARSKGKGGKVAKKHFANTAKMHNSKLLPTDRHTAGASAPGNSSSSRSSRPSSASGSRRQPTTKTTTATARIRPSSKENSFPTTGTTSNRKAAATRSTSNDSGADATAATLALKKKNAELVARNAELEIEVSNMEKERDFYFSKLRDVELIMQVHDEHVKEGLSNDGDSEAVIEKIFTILYAKSEDDIHVDDDGNIIGAAVNQSNGDDFSDADDEESFIDDVMGGETSVLQEEEDNYDDNFTESAQRQQAEPVIDSFHEMGVADDDEDLLVDAY